MIRNQRIERLFATVLVLIMLCGIFPNTQAHAASSSDVILDIPWNYINSCGHQAVSGPCQAYCWAYCRIILDKVPHTYRDYYVNGVGGVGPSAAGYNDGKTASSVSDLLQNVYDNINQGRPVMLRVVGSYSYHYVVAVGYRANSNRNILKTSDILILNPANKAISSSAGSNQHIHTWILVLYQVIGIGLLKRVELRPQRLLALHQIVAMPLSGKHQSPM